MGVRDPSQRAQSGNAERFIEVLRHVIQAGLDPPNRFPLHTIRFETAQIRHLTGIQVSVRNPQPSDGRLMRSAFIESGADVQTGSIVHTLNKISSVLSSL